ncbi:heme ABC exporter ATP-binding protein CcmA [Devosia albogilva]|uniref:Heme ABC exporter ATP-binding protein CcmA n=1 Tax=Devosia albogilva TaxID=429726 RepID=A0ABW5QJD0_9HYPH
MTQGQVRPYLRTTALACGRGGMPLVVGLDLTVGSGRCLVLRGPNGAGKSTLLLTLAGLVAPLAGTVEIEAEDGVHLLSHRNAVKPRLTVRENLDFWAGVNGPTGIESSAALERVGLGAITHLDAGYLSAGQTRRLALARLLVTRRPVWLLDEPTAALDAEGHALVAALIGEHLAGGGLAVAATHDPLALDPATVDHLTIEPAR